MRSAAQRADKPQPTELPLDSLVSLGAALTQSTYAKRGVPQADTLIRVALVDDHTLVRQGIRALLKSEPDIEVVCEAPDGDEAVAIVSRFTPDVVLMDLDMPKVDGLTATRALLASERPPKVLVLTMHGEEDRLIATLQAGASGYLTKDAAERELAEAIRVVARGEIYVRPRVAQLLAANVRPSSQVTDTVRARTKFADLSDREQVVLKLVAEGFNGPEIGSKLGITAKTVDTYKQRIEDKLGLAHRTDYVRFALAAELLGR